MSLKVTDFVVGGGEHSPLFMRILYNAQQKGYEGDNLLRYYHSVNHFMCAGNLLEEAIYKADAILEETLIECEK